MTAKKVAIMVDEMYQVLEVWFPYYRLKEAGLEVNLVEAEAKKQYHKFLTCFSLLSYRAEFLYLHLLQKNMS